MWKAQTNLKTFECLKLQKKYRSLELSDYMTRFSEFSEKIAFELGFDSNEFMKAFQTSIYRFQETIGRKMNIFTLMLFGLLCAIYSTVTKKSKIADIQKLAEISELCSPSSDNPFKTFDMPKSSRNTEWLVALNKTNLSDNSFYVVNDTTLFILSKNNKMYLYNYIMENLRKTSENNTIIKVEKSLLKKYFDNKLDNDLKKLDFSDNVLKSNIIRDYQKIMAEFSDDIFMTSSDFKTYEKSVNVFVTDIKHPFIQKTLISLLAIFCLTISTSTIIMKYIHSKMMTKPQSIIYQLYDYLFYRQPVAIRNA
tara:strand:- start:13 stop:939 length:927 start_codon:yes stop_codon:yes gene_type:complete